MLSLHPVRKRHQISYAALLGILLSSSASYAASEGTVTDKSPTVSTVEVKAPTTDATQSTPISSANGGSDGSVAKASETTKPASTVRLHGEVTDCASPELSKGIDDLVKAALDKVHRAELLAKEKHYKTTLARLAASTRDLAELCTEYKGFEQSSEAADIILDEKYKLKSGSAVAYVKQKQADTTHERIITALMQIATGIGATDQEQGNAAIRDGVAEIQDLTDADQAQKTVETLKTWCQSQKVMFHPPLAGPMAIQAECHDVLGRAIQGDPVVKEVTKSLHKFNGRSKLARVTAKVVNTTLSITELSPTIISPASQIAWTAYIMTQGGPEESKLLKEVYLAKRFENRYQTLNNETSLAVNSYNSALMSQNPALLAFSQFVIGQLCQPPQPAVQPNSVDGKAPAIIGKDQTGKTDDKVANKDSAGKTDNKAADKDLAARSDDKVADKDSASKTDDKVAEKDSAGKPAENAADKDSSGNAGEVASKEPSSGSTK